jgi:hypothetical protein
MEDMRNVYKVLIGNSEGKRQLRRTKRRWENSTMGVKDRGCGLNSFDPG